jgi:hypothetical protein
VVFCRRVSPGLDSRSVREVVDSLKSSLGVKAWEQAKTVTSSHANAEVLRAVIKCCSDEVCSVLERNKPVCPRVAHAALFSTATHAVSSAGGDVSAMLSTPPPPQAPLDGPVAVLRTMLTLHDVSLVPYASVIHSALGITSVSDFADISESDVAGCVGIPVLQRNKLIRLGKAHNLGSKCD